MNTLKLAAAFLLLATCSLRAQDECPDQTVKPVPASQKAELYVDCGTSVTVGDVGVRARGRCPTLVVVTPAHDRQCYVPGSGTRVEELYRNPIIHYQFVCKTRWLLFVPIGTKCVAAGSRHAGTVPTLGVFACEVGGEES